MARFKKQRGLGENWHLLTGDSEQTRQLAGLLKFDNFAMDEHFIHEFRIYVLDAAGNIETTIEWGDNPEQKIETIFNAGAGQ